jgi:hypothetical protein
MKRIFSAIFLILGVVITLGAFGHGSQLPKLHAALDPYPINPDIGTMLFVVWYFVSGL